MHGYSYISFTVVIPVYNGSATICRAVDSVLLQTWPPAQIVVADDASTDNTVALLHSAYGNRITILRIPQNGGSAIARNRGIDIAKGTHIAFLDADDEWHPEKLATVAKALVIQPQANLLFHNYMLYHQSSPVLPPVITLSSLSYCRLLSGNCIVTSCAVIRAGMGFRFDEGMRHTEDYDLWLRIAYSGMAYSLPGTLTILHRPVTSAGGISSNIWAMRKGELKAYTHLIRYNVIFVLLIPFLWLYSLTKHAVRAIGFMRKGVSYSKLKNRVLI